MSYSRLGKWSFLSALLFTWPSLFASRSTSLCHAPSSSTPPTRVTGSSGILCSFCFALRDSGHQAPGTNCFWRHNLVCSCFRGLGTRSLVVNNPKRAVEFNGTGFFDFGYSHRSVQPWASGMVFANHTSLSRRRLLRKPSHGDTAAAPDAFSGAPSSAWLSYGRPLQSITPGHPWRSWEVQSWRRVTHADGCKSQSPSLST
jgi:hypothetical protein